MSDSNPETAELEDVMRRLYAVVEARKGADPSDSYTAKLYAKGREKIAQKLGEEAVETVIAATRDVREDIIYESVDVLFHMLVLWADAGIGLDEICEELQRREGVSGIAEKNARKEKK